MSSPLTKMKFSNKRMLSSETNGWPLPKTGGDKSLASFIYEFNSHRYEMQIKNDAPVYMGHLRLEEKVGGGLMIKGDVQFNYADCERNRTHFTVSVVHGSSTIAKRTWPSEATEKHSITQPTHKMIFILLNAIDFLGPETYSLVQDLISSGGLDPVRLLLNIEACDPDHEEYNRAVRSEIEACEWFNQDFCSLWESKQFTDITLQASTGEKFEAHRSILAARSKYFFDKLQNDPDGKFEGLVKFNNIQGMVLKAALTWIYTGQYKPTDDDEVAEILYGAYTFKLDAFKKVCSKELVKTLIPENALSLFMVGAECECDYLQRKVTQYMIDRCRNLFLGPPFTEFGSLKPTSRKYKAWRKAMERYNVALEADKKKLARP